MTIDPRDHELAELAEQLDGLGAPRADQPPGRSGKEIENVAVPGAGRSLISVNSAVRLVG